MLGGSNGGVRGMPCDRMMTSSLHWIADRSYKTEAGSVTARLGQPTLEPTGEWSCSIELIGPGIQHRSNAYGEDSLQALLLGLSKLRLVLTSDKKLQSLSWLDQAGHGIELLG